MRRKILCRIPCAWDATALYRSTGPFNDLRTKADYSFKEAHTYNWVVIGSHDAVFLQRPFTEQDLQLAHLTKRCNKPLVIDFDDDLFSVPEHNPAFKFYASEKTHEIMRRVVALADQVIVSTQELAKVYNQFRGTKDACVIIPNAFPDHMRAFDKTVSPREKIISWRGSNTHAMDLRTIHPAIVHVTKNYPDWKWAFIGDADFDTLNLVPREQRIQIPTQDPLDYLETFKTLKPTVHIIPLLDNQFNRAKSNIAWIEATFAGAATIAPNWPEWQKQGVLTYSNLEEFVAKLVGIIQKPESAQSHVFASYDDTPLISELWQARLDVFEKAINR